MLPASTQSLRMELAEKGKEIMPEALQNILQAAAEIATLLHGVCVIDSLDDWGLWVELVDEEPDYFIAEILWFDDDPKGEMN